MKAFPHYVMSNRPHKDIEQLFSCHKLHARVEVRDLRKDFVSRAAYRFQTGFRSRAACLSRAVSLFLSRAISLFLSRAVSLFLSRAVSLFLSRAAKVFC